MSATFTDHNPVLLELSICNNFRGPGFWKFNTKHLLKKDFIDEINETLDLVDFRYSELNPENTWEMLKHDVRETAMYYSRRTAALRKAKLLALQRQLVAGQKKLAMINLSSNEAVSLIQKTNDKIDKIKNELQKEAIYDAQGAELRAKARWTSQAEHGTSYFYGLEKRNA